MEFTEVQEFNNLALHSRSFMPGQLLPTDNTTLSTYRTSAIQSVIPALMFDYEKALEDTPPASPSKYFTTQNAATLKLLEKHNEESIEDLLSSIKNSIREYSELIEVPTRSAPLEPVEPHSPTKDQENNMLLIENGEKEQKDGEANRIQLQFEKVAEDYVSKSYIETKNLKSFLSSSIKAYPMNKEYNTLKRAEIKTFKVYFLSEKYSTLLPISFAIPVKDIIKQCLDTFKLNKAISDGLMKYPDRPDAYELQRDMVTGPLDRQKTLKEIRIGRELVVVESRNFDASKPYVESQDSQNDASPQNVSFKVTLHLPTEDRAKVTLQMGGGKQLKDLFSKLALEGKTGFNMQQYNLRLYSSDPEMRWKESKNFLDTNIPLKNIKAFDPEHIQLELVKKKFADEPNEPLVDHRTTSSPVKKAGAADMAAEDDNQIILYNEVSANHYEEFEVTKINENGRKQERILGVDGFKIYNYTKSYKQEQQGGRIGEMFTNLFFSKFGTMNPERLLTDVSEAKILGPKVFQICVISEGKTKWLCYEAVDHKTANQIVAKISYLKGLQEKKNICTSKGSREEE